MPPPRRVQRPSGARARVRRALGREERTGDRLTCPTLALALIWLAPIAVLPGLHERWGWPTLILGVAAVLAALQATPAGRLPRWLWAGLGAAALVAVIAATLAVDPLGALFGRAPRYEGLVGIPVLVGALWVGARLLGPYTGAAAVRTTMQAVSVAALLLGGLALLEALGLRPIETDLSRPGSLGGNAPDQGVLGVVFAGILAHTVWGARRRTGVMVWWAVAGAGGAVVAVVTSASRAAFLAAAIVAAAFVVRAVVGARRRRRASLIAVVGTVAVVGGVLAIPAVRDRILAIDRLASQTIGDRFTMWGDALELLAQHPWTGLGPSGYVDAVPTVFGDDWYRTATVDSILTSPHNVLLQVALAGGIPLLLLALGLLVGLWVVGLRHARAADGPRRDLLIAALAVVPAGGVALLFSPTSPKTLLPLAVLGGALVAVGAGAPLGRLARTIGSVAVGLWLLWLGLCAVADARVHEGMRASAAGQVDAADAAFSAAAALRPWDADVPLLAARALGGAYTRGVAGAEDVATRWAERAVERLPASASAHESAGMVALERGDVPAAVDALSQAVARSPSNPRLAHELALAQLVAGDLHAARDGFARALALAPDADQSRLALDDVCDQLGDTGGVCAG